jgi:hypothetical protein
MNLVWIEKSMEDDRADWSRINALDLYLGGVELDSRRGTD